MTYISKERLVLALLALAAAGVAPNIFPVAQAGIAKMSDLAIWFLLPSIGVLAAVTAIIFWRGHRVLGRRLVVGAAAGAIATLGLEAVRMTGFHFGGMPGDMPRLLGVLLTDRFMLGPSTLSDGLGFAYHFWNGATFGLIFSVILGKRSVLWTLAYGVLVGVGFLASPAVVAMGVGFFASEMPIMIVTVILAHIAFGLVLGVVLRRWLPDSTWLTVSCPHETSDVDLKVAC
jgi:hypothetical protein